MKIFFKDRCNPSFQIGTAFLCIVLIMPAGMTYAAGSNHLGDSMQSHEIMAESMESLSSGTVYEKTASTSMTDQAEAGLRRALAAMATRQWSGGWGDGWTLNGQLIWGQHRPIPYNWFTIEPVATPGIARIFVRAADVLNDDIYLHHAHLAQQAILSVQSKDGGFPKESTVTAGPSRNGTFDDDVTTGALDLFIDIWKFTGDEADRQAILSVGEFMLQTQYPESGGWPQVHPPNPEHYNRHITFNDRAMTNVIESLLHLYELFGDTRYLEAARRGGECIIRMQGPPGEDIWGAQHDSETLKPAAARAFEPVAYSSGESRAAIEALMSLYLATGEERFLEPLPKAFAWYDANRLPDGNWARFYEPGTMKPIYGDHDGKVYYRLEDISQERQDGYGWEGNYYPHSAKEAYDRIQETGRTAYLAEQQSGPANQSELAPRVGEVLEAQHPDGWWTEEVRRPMDFTILEEAEIDQKDWIMIWASTFVRNTTLLLDYIEAGSSSAYQDR